jgi:hypothetical protein
MSINWDNFKRTEGDFPDRWRPENAGDTVTGKITQMRIATMPDGSTYPSLTITTKSGEREILASQTRLLAILSEKQPRIGDTITITHTIVEKLAGGKTLKHFDVEIKGAVVTADEDIL